MRVVQRSPAGVMHRDLFFEHVMQYICKTGLPLAIDVPCSLIFIPESDNLGF